jgi:hypothetical protein
MATVSSSNWTSEMQKQCHHSISLVIQYALRVVWTNFNVANYRKIKSLHLVDFIKGTGTNHHTEYPKYLCILAYREG